jgi:hypothetical protein
VANQRVVHAEVVTIFPTTIDTQPFIVGANLLVSERLEPTGSYSAARLHQIELYLSAHFACVADPRVTRMDADGASVTYEGGKMGEGLASTRYGQQVMLLDYLGLLAQDSLTTQPAWLRVH